MTVFTDPRTIGFSEFQIDSSHANDNGTSQLYANLLLVSLYIDDFL